MKTKVKYLATVSVMSLLLLISGTLSAQTSVARERIIAVQSGTITLENGKANVELNTQVQNILNESQASYYVVFTPYENAGSISLLEKSNSMFSVAGMNVVNAKADYIVFLKQVMTNSSTDYKSVTAK